MSDIFETTKNLVVSHLRRPRVQISVLLSTIITIIVIRYLYNRLYQRIEQNVSSSSNKRTSSSSSSSSRKRISSSSSSSSKRRSSTTDDEVKNENDEEMMKKRSSKSNGVDTETKKPTSPSKKKKSENNNDETANPLQGVFGSGHERLGHVVTVRVKNEDHQDLEGCAKQFAASLKGSSPIHVVLRDTAGVQGELRQPTHAPLWIDKEKALASANEIINKILRRGRKLGMIAEEADAKPMDSFGKYQLTRETLKKLSASPTFTVHIEKGTKYSLDADRVMFCSGNTTERMHFGTEVVATGETVVDMFAGIGYFTIPLSSGINRPNRLIAIEKNPESCAFLACNALLNDCYDKLIIMNGDNREVGNVFLGKANRILMGYIPCCKSFLPRAVSFLVSIPNEKANKGKAVKFAPGSTPPQQKSSSATEEDNKTNNKQKKIADDDDDDQEDEGKKDLLNRPVGVIHYHYLSESKDKNSAKATAMLHVLESLGPQLGSLCDIREVRVVKSYAPKKFHCVADLHFE